MTFNRTLSSAFLGLALLMGTAHVAAPVFAAPPELSMYVGQPAPSFADPQAAADALKAGLTSGDLDALAKLLGLNAEKLKAYEGINETVSQMKDAISSLITIDEDDDRRIINMGDKLWPFPFPLAKTADGKWSFDTIAGLEEILNRRIGENENQAIDTMRAYVDAQRDYASIDHDGDGVLEYAQKLISTPGQTDGLYWPIEQGDGESPAGAFVDQTQLDKAKNDKGYFGYHFRILRAQGNQVAGGRYHYVINGNMIAGFGLIAWPVEYARTGVHTFVVNQSGIVYEADLGPDTTAIVDQIRRFNPGPDWKIVED